MIIYDQIYNLIVVYVYTCSFSGANLSDSDTVSALAYKKQRFSGIKIEYTS